MTPSATIQVLRRHVDVLEDAGDGRVLGDEGDDLLQWEALNAQAHRELGAVTRRLLRRAGAWYVLPISTRYRGSRGRSDGSQLHLNRIHGR